jgi:hypothetical protein
LTSKPQSSSTTNKPDFKKASEPKRVESVTTPNPVPSITKVI